MLLILGSIMAMYFEHISSFAVCPYVCFSQSPSPKMALTPEETGTGLPGARTPVAGGTGRREATPSLATVQVCTGDHNQYSN